MKSRPTSRLKSAGKLTNRAVAGRQVHRLLGVVNPRIERNGPCVAAAMILVNSCAPGVAGYPAERWTNLYGPECFFALDDFSRLGLRGVGDRGGRGDGHRYTREVDVPIF